MILNIYSFIYFLIFKLASFFVPFSKNAKLIRFFQLREKEPFIKIVNQIAKQTAQKGVYWVHIASAGEYEQALPALKTIFDSTQIKFFVTYFSPSAEAFIKDTEFIVAKSGLPIDSAILFRWALTKINCQGLFFVRYDIWPGLLLSGSHLNKKIYLLCARKSSKKNRILLSIKEKYNSFIYNKFTVIFAVTTEDQIYYKSICTKPSILLAGDTKWQRAYQRAQNAHTSKVVQQISAHLKTIEHDAPHKNSVMVFGSPHKEELSILKSLLAQKECSLTVILCPHEIHESALQSLKDDFPEGVFLSEIAQDNRYKTTNTKQENKKNLTKNLLIVDSMGSLAEIYSLGTWAIVGGGFDGLLHNVLESAAHGVGTVFGNNLARCQEAQILIKEGAALAFAAPEHLFQFLHSCSRVEARPKIEHDTLARDLRLNAERLFSCLPATSDVLRSVFTSHAP